MCWDVTTVVLSLGQNKWKKIPIFNSLILFIFINVTSSDSAVSKKFPVWYRENNLYIYKTSHYSIFVVLFIQALKSSCYYLKQKAYLRHNFSILYRSILYPLAFPCNKTIIYYSPTIPFVANLPTDLSSHTLNGFMHWVAVFCSIWYVCFLSHSVLIRAHVESIWTYFQRSHHVWCQVSSIQFW